jgi:hypothetical protein
MTWAIDRAHVGRGRERVRLALSNRCERVKIVVDAKPSRTNATRSAEPAALQAEG